MNYSGCAKQNLEYKIKPVESKAHFSTHLNHRITLTKSCHKAPLFSFHKGRCHYFDSGWICGIWNGATDPGPSGRERPPSSSRLEGLHRRRRAWPDQSLNYCLSAGPGIFSCAIRFLHFLKHPSGLSPDKASFTNYTSRGYYFPLYRIRDKNINSKKRVKIIALLG